jgi:hypothetical protein
MIRITDNRNLSVQADYLEARVDALRAECDRLERENAAMLVQIGRENVQREALTDMIDLLERELHSLRGPVDGV